MSERKSYGVVATRSQGWWAIQVPELRGAWSQAKRIADIEATTRDLIATFLDVPADSFDVDPIRFEGAAANMAESAKARRLAAQEAARVADRATREAAREMIRQGLPTRDVAALLELSPGRISQIVAEAKVSA